MTNTPTPKTDELLQKIGSPEPATDYEISLINHARTLERELAAANAKAENTV